VPGVPPVSASDRGAWFIAGLPRSATDCCRPATGEREVRSTPANKTNLVSGDPRRSEPPGAARPERIVVLTGRNTACRALVTVIETVAPCHVTHDLDDAIRQDAIAGLVVDTTPERYEARRRLKALSRRFGGRVPFVVLVHDGSDAFLRAAEAAGAAACLPSFDDPRAIVATLLGFIDPGATIAKRIVQREVARTGVLFANLFDTAREGRVDIAAIETSLDQLLNALLEGGLIHWLDTVWRHDHITFQHCLLVAGLAAHFAQQLGMSTPDRQRLTRAALLHDIGKARIPAAILNKPGRLTPEESDVMRTHAPIGHDLLAASGCRDAITLQVVRHHHEMLDGTGYPDGLSGAAIADPIRLLTICDIYAALIERRSYKPPLPSAEAMRILAGMTGKLDMRLVEAFGRAVSRSANAAPAAA